MGRSAVPGVCQECEDEGAGGGHKLKGKKGSISIVCRRGSVLMLSSREMSSCKNEAVGCLNSEGIREGQLASRHFLVCLVVCRSRRYIPDGVGHT